jgi:hypothetical protein
MDCKHFMTRASDYFDASTDERESALMEAHLRHCVSCQRYKVVYQEGTSLLRGLPEPELRDDFESRLRHRLLHVDDRRALLDHSGSATPALTVLGLSVLLTVVAWSPLLRAEPPVVDLDPIVVDRVVEPTRVYDAVGSRTAVAFSSLGDGLWDDARLYEYTRLSKRYARESGVRRAGFDRD